MSNEMRTGTTVSEQEATQTETSAGFDSATSEPTAADQLAAVRAELDKSRALLEQAKHDRDVQRALFDAGAIDIEAVSGLVENAIRTGAPDVNTAVEVIRKAKPQLFRARPTSVTPGTSESTTIATRWGSDRRPSTGSAMSSTPASTQTSEKELAARETASTGDRNALMTYLRMRRSRELA